MVDFKSLREKMIEEQLISRGIKDKKVIEAFREIPRDLFVSRECSESAYCDHPLPIGNNQTISQPYMVALMTEKLSLNKEDRVLEVGTGSGYQAAILAKLCKEVYSVERFPELAKRAKDVLADLGIKNVHIETGDGTLGLDKYAPYDGIMVTASAPEVPKPLIDQLDEGGRLLIPVGSMSSQILLRLKKINNHIEREEICDCVFVPMVGRFGWLNAKDF